MRLITGTTEFNIQEATAVAIGKFDGIHKGHQKLLGQMAECKKQGLKTVVFTFDPPPASFFSKKILKELTTKEEKRALFEKIGIDVLIEFPLNEMTAAMSADRFIEDILAEKLSAGIIVAGTDVSFGYRGAGDYKLLTELSPDCGYEVRLIEKICFRGREISSSYVREEVEAGHMETVRKLLGTDYQVTGRIRHGSQIGRTLGFPTVNLIPPDNKLLPPNGVYYSSIWIQGEKHRGITNIGYKPTVSDEAVLGVETYIYNFDREVYGEEISVSLLGFKRPEQRFENVGKLREKLLEDIEEGKNYLSAE